jgi:cell wall-associated NlpC family hydrolase
MSVLYRVGLSESDVSEDVLVKSGLRYHKVLPREQIIASARSVVGKPYKRGASVLRDAPNAFDCSSLTAWSAVEAGLAIPRVAIDQFVFSTRINKEELNPGDLVFSNTGLIIHTDGSYYSQVLDKNVEEVPIRTETLEYLPGTKVPEGVDHVGIYIGDGDVLHATTGSGVVVDKLDTSTGFKNIVGYGRIINDDSPRYVVEIPDDKKELRDSRKLASFLTQNLL